MDGAILKNYMDEAHSSNSHEQKFTMTENEAGDAKAA